MEHTGLGGEISPPDPKQHCWGRGWRGAVRRCDVLDPERAALRVLLVHSACSQSLRALRSLGVPRVNYRAYTAPQRLTAECRSLDSPLARDDGDERSRRIRARGRGDKAARASYLADVITLEPTTLEGHGVRLEPMTPAHEPDIATAAADGKLWELWYTAVPAPHETAAYITTALEGQRAGHMLPWVVRE